MIQEAPEPGRPFGPPPPAPPTAPPAPSGAPRRSSGGRFLGGAAVGAVVGALVAGGIVAVVEHDGGPAVHPQVAALAVGRPAATSAVDGAPGDNRIHTLVEAAEPSVVSIHDSIAQTDMFGRQVEGQAAGTGFVLSRDGFIVTNDHVVDGATDITVAFSDGKEAAATVVAADPGSDLAVLKVDRTGLRALPLGDSGALEVGDQVVAIGNALDLSGQPTVTTGIVSATDRSLVEPNGEHLANLLQTDTAINPGNSGGPLLDMQGHVVGINTAVAGQAQNIGFAIAIDPAEALIGQLSKGEVPDHALLGVRTQPGEGGGAAVTDVSAGSAAEDAGLRAGDVITNLDDTSIDTPDDLASAIAGHRPGDEVAVTFERAGHPHTVTVTLRARPVGN